ncbi:hypothetical protein H310_15302 [Aphanomyces invadans]|uniref:Uncharacterized protein n=1 Tax=Aphanomyces invadans TaxID=157072 RepID=A0A024T7I6_9STRA|nr:hypothetical protein H310_15302 [Aphanomyces invadans]ETV89860.1 hypothetical protein H310_15302 [Aphanomyces invadans]|eukprot:XP_008881508.1 hypothetical protein H310_15302 [Aphanomyces invadans]
MADRFDGVKNNQMKKDAYDLLAAELSIEMERVFDARSAQNKIHDLKQQYFKPQVKATGNGLLVRSKPQYFDIMFEYWGSMPGLSRDTSMSSDVPALDGNANTDVLPLYGNDVVHDSDASSSALESECDEPTVKKSPLLERKLFSTRPSAVKKLSVLASNLWVLRLRQHVLHH